MTAEPFEAALVKDEHGKASWTWRLLEDADFSRAKAHFVDGLTVREAVAEMGVSKSKVGRLYQRAKAEGFAASERDG